MYVCLYTSPVHCYDLFFFRYVIRVLVFRTQRLLAPSRLLLRCSRSSHLPKVASNFRRLAFYGLYLFQISSTFVSVYQYVLEKHIIMVHVNTYV